ncbi:MAG: flavocytochrome c [Oscillospiraceae bacterium]|nr:flavocytochrome c [Oscillospiraceae bacterium]
MKKRFLPLLLAGILTCSLSACNSQGQPPSGETAEGMGQGYGGVIRVKVTLSADKSQIEEIDLTENNETPEIGGKAMGLLTDSILKEQTVNLDAISGATLASQGFLTAVKGALTAAGADLNNFNTPVDHSGEEQTLEVDVVIVGAGGAGMTAGIAAARAGSKVVILEKTAMSGGNSVRSTGGMNAAETKYQNDNGWNEAAGVEKALEAAEAYPALAKLAQTVRQEYNSWRSSPKGYFDSTNLFILDTMIGGKAINDLDLVTTLAERSADAIDWLDSIGASLHSVGAFGGASVRRIHRPVSPEGKILSVGSYLVPILEQGCIDNGVDIIFNAPVTEILMQDGKAVGVRAEGYTVNAQAVVLATGGFGANLEMVAQLKPELKGFVTTNAPSITGDGIRLAQAVGAATVDMDQIQIHPTVEQKTSALITEGLRGDGAILVNQEGQRFCDEVGTRDAVSAAELVQTGSYAYLIVDQRMAEASDVIAGYIKKGYATLGDTPGQLAESLEIPAEAFTDTIDRWNAAVAAGRDGDFGRTSFAAPLDTAPYYAIRVAPGVHHTMGGVKIDPTAQVLDSKDIPIPGLFAAGEVTGGIHGANRLGGNAVADFVVFGQIAGESAAAYEK